MSFRTAKCVILTCDNCHNSWENSDGFIEHFDTETEALSEAEVHDDWYTDDDGKAYCDRCRVKVPHEHNFDNGWCVICAQSEQYINGLVTT